MPPRPLPRSAPRPGRKRLRRHRRRGARFAAVLLALGAAAIAVAVLTATGLGPASRHQLVASSKGQPASGTSSATAGDAIDESMFDDAGPAAAGPPGDSAPGHRQGGSTLPSPAAGPSVNVPILLYHYIRGNPRARDREGFRLSVTPENFARQMALLDHDGVRTVSLADVMAALVPGGPKLPPRSVVLTFDDGHDDFAFRAVPVLNEYGFTATAFVVPGFLGRSSYMTTAQVKSVAAAGMTIGAHTMHHVDLARVSQQVATDEITRSRTVLRGMTGQPVNDFAYPYGIFTSRVIGIVRQAGFADASTTEPGTRQYASQPFLLRRIEISGYDNLWSFAHKAGLPPPPRNFQPPTEAAAASPSPGPSPSPSPSAPEPPIDTPTPRPIIG